MKNMEIETSVKATFPGGAHPPETKSLTRDRPIQTVAPAGELAILLGQHIGAPLESAVAKKQQVRAGEKIADAEAFVSAPVHSPVSGTVKEVGLQPHPVLGRGPAVVIQPNQQEQLKKPVCKRFENDFDASRYEPEAIKQAVREAGIIGMGGAGFPTHVKLEAKPDRPLETMLVNGCECEPYITCDERVMLEWTAQVLAGARLIARAAGCERIFVCIEDNKPECIDVFNRAAGGDGAIQVAAVKTKYPQGGERQLIKSVLGKDVPTGGIPPMIGVLVSNVATAAAVAEAMVLEAPLTHRVVTVTGKGVNQPGNFYVPVGMPVSDLIEHCGGLTDVAVRVVLGGPMMGFAIGDLSTPITKTTGAITVLTADEMGPAKIEAVETPCIRCGRCLEACPAGINPTRIAHAVKHNMLDLAERYYISACIECGCCSYVCPANIELSGHIKTGKVLLARQKKKMPK